MIRTVAETGSTNADLIAAARAGTAEGMWLRAEQQTAGRGRLGRDWVSPPGNLHASTIVRPLAGDPPVETLALVAGVALAETAQSWSGAMAPALKWPNDLMAGGAKLAGILLERAGEAVVIGFGVNLAHRPEGIDRPATSLAALGGSAPDPELFLADLAEAFARWLQRWRGEGLKVIRRAWLERAHPVGTALAAGPIEGLFDGLDEDGALRLRRRDGEVVRVRAGEVFLI